MPHKQKIHPMVAMKDEIARRGLVVFDNVHTMPVYDEPYTSPHLVVALNLKGWVKTEFNMQPVLFKEHELAVVPPNQILCNRDSSEDYHAIIIVMSPTIQEELKHLHTEIYKRVLHYRFRPCIKLDNKEFQIILDLMKILIPISQADSAHSKEMACEMVKIIFLHLMDYKVSSGLDDYRPTPREELFTRFYNLIEEHYRESHEVKFYADKLCMSPKHFATVIKDHTGVNALAWINQYVIIQAKSMLRHMQMMSVQQIADQVGFRELASFSRFFRNNTGMTPSEYREKSSDEIA